MRIVCDTNVLVRAVISPHGSAAELLRVIVERHSLILSLHLLGELYDVLRRPELRRLHRLDDRRIRRIVSRMYQLATVVALPSQTPTFVPHDPQDDPIVATAIAGQAEILCTLDHHLHHADVVALCASQGIRVCRDDLLLSELQDK